MTTQQANGKNNMDIATMLSILQGFNQANQCNASQCNQYKSRFDWDENSTLRLLSLKEEGYTYSEIAKKMGVTKGAIRNKLYRIRQGNAQKAETRNEAATVKMTIIYENGVLTVNDITISRKEV